MLSTMQVYYNNALSLPLLCVVAAASGEFSKIATEPAIYNRGFQAAACLSAFCGFIISFCSLWFLSTTTATTFSLVGSLNKVLVRKLSYYHQTISFSLQLAHKHEPCMRRSRLPSWGCSSSTPHGARSTSPAYWWACLPASSSSGPSSSPPRPPPPLNNDRWSVQE